MRLSWDDVHLAIERIVLAREVGVRGQMESAPKCTRSACIEHAVTRRVADLVPLAVGTKPMDD
jgi:hypothetical protein